MDKLRAIIESVRTTRFWGAEYTGHDVLSSRVHGDGKQLLCVTMLNTRPWSHYIFVDSSLDAEDADRDEIEKILCLLEDEYCDYESMCNCLEEDGLDPHGEDNDHEDLKFPVINTSSGYGWCAVDVSEFLGESAA